MEKFLAIGLASLLLGVKASSLGATTTNEQQEFSFNPETCLYNRLGFGNESAMLRFMWEQVKYVTIVITDQSGDFDFNSPPYEYFREAESFEEFVSRTSNLLLKHAIEVNGFSTNQLKIRYGFKSGNTNGRNNQVSYLTHFGTFDVDFTPQAVTGGYIVPTKVISSLNLWMPADGVLRIPWMQVKRASLIVFDQVGKLVYSGDTVQNNINDRNFAIDQYVTLNIGRKFVTNGYSGILTVALDKNRPGGTYLLKDGVFVPYPSTISPFLAITQKKSQVIVEIMGGAPLQEIALLCSTNLNSRPSERIITLDEVGSVKWTNTSSSPTGFFSTRYAVRTEVVNISIKR